jgi:type I restriction enzyme S subunit
MGDFDFNHIDKSKWKKYRFEQIAKSIGERVEPKQTDLEVYVGLEHIDSDSVHIKRTGVPSDVEGTKLRVYPGDVIFGKRRAYQRKAAIATFDGICSAHAMVLRAIESVIDPKLFPFFLHSDYFMDRAIDISVGSLSPTINWGTLKTQEFLLPPKDQQAKLAELLWAADEAVELKDELRRQLKSLINLEVEKYNHAKYKKSNLGDVLQRKKEVSLPPHLREKYIGLENIESGSFTCLGFSSSTDAIANCFCFDEGDLLYSKLRPY